MDFRQSHAIPSHLGVIDSYSLHGIDMSDIMSWLLRIKLDCRASGIISLFADDNLRAEVSERLLQFWQFFRARTGPMAGAALSIRDLLSWAGFIKSAAPSIGALPAYTHGAHLTLLDGISLGARIPAEVRPYALSYA
jgi:hypothetical protein